MRKICNYRIADSVLELDLPEGLCEDTLLPSFRPFRTGYGAQPLLKVNADVIPEPGHLIPMEQSVNDAGTVSMYKTPSGEWWMRLKYTGIDHHLLADADFTSALADIDFRDPDAGMVLSSMLRIAWSQAILAHGGISIHASAVAVDGRAFLFMGRSGTGKSTHARLWLRNAPGSWLLNDDNPAVRIVDGAAYTYGTPWSGKTPVYLDRRIPLGGIARLEQSSCNSFSPKEGAEAFLTIYPGCSALHKDAVQDGRLCDILETLTGLIPVSVMKCRPDNEAAIECMRGFKGPNTPRL